MTQDKIRAQRDALTEQGDELDRQREHLRVEWGALQRKCKHPDKRRYMAMGREESVMCPDCGWNE